MEDYIEHLWLDGEGISVAGDTISSLQHFDKAANATFQELGDSSRHGSCVNYLPEHHPLPSQPYTSCLDIFNLVTLKSPSAFM